MPFMWTQSCPVLSSPVSQDLGRFPEVQLANMWPAVAVALRCAGPRAWQGYKGPEDRANLLSGWGGLPQLSCKGLAWSLSQAASLPGRGLCVPIRTTASHPGSARKAEVVHPKISFILPPPRRAGAGNGQKECWRPSQTRV